VVWAHDTMPGYVHHSRRHDGTEHHSTGSDNQHRAKLSHLSSDGRLQEIDSIVADSHEEIKHCQTEQEDHDTKINRTHIVLLF